MLAAMLIGLAVMVVLGSTAMAYSLGGGADCQRSDEAPVRRSRPPVLFHPTGWSAGGTQLPIEELVASIEEHVRRERVAAESFARDPSARYLWLD